MIFQDAYFRYIRLHSWQRGARKKKGFDKNVNFLRHFGTQDTSPEINWSDMWHILLVRSADSIIEHLLQPLLACWHLPLTVPNRFSLESLPWRPGFSAPGGGRSNLRCQLMFRDAAQIHKYKKTKWKIWKYVDTKILHKYKKNTKYIVNVSERHFSGRTRFYCIFFLN